MRKKVAIIGAGNVGATTALFVVNSGLADVALYDIVEGMPQGKALDILQNTAVTGVKSDISGTNSLDDMAGSDIVVITAGLARKPGMRRKDLLMANTEIVGGIVKQIADICPQAIYIVVTNPMDVMAYVTLAVSGVNRQRVLGMGGVLDSSRFKTFISIELKVSPRDIETLVLGGHGLYMVPLIRYTTVKGIPISKWLSKEKIEALVQRTREGGAEIVSLLKQALLIMLLRNQPLRWLNQLFLMKKEFCHALFILMVNTEQMMYLMAFLLYLENRGLKNS